MFFFYNAIISMVIVISLIAMAKSFIWFTRKLFDFVYCSTKLLKCISTALRTVKSVIVLRWRGRDKPTRSSEKNEQRCARGRHSHHYSKKPCKEKRDIVVSERSKYCGSIVAILWEIKSRSERVVSVCHRELGKVNRQGRKNGVRGTPFIMNSQEVRESISKNNIFHQQEKYAPFWKPNRSPVRRVSGATPEQGDNVANQKRIDCLMETPPPVNGRGRKNDNCGMIEKGSLSSNVKCVLSNAENGVNSGLEICKTPLDKMKTGRSYEPGKVVQRTSSTKYHVRLWSVDSHMSVKTATAVQSGNQGSSENTTKQNENDAICPNKNSKNDCKNKELDNQNDPKSKYFPCSVEALANMMLNVLMGGYWPLWDNASIEKKASSVEINPQGKHVHLRRSGKTLAKVMMHMVTFAVWPLWGSIKEDWELFNDIYGETPPIACNTDHEIIARVKGHQDMVNHDCYNNCLHCLANREEGDRSESMEIIGTSKDHDEYTLNDNSPRSLETLKNKAQALHFHIKGLIVTLLSCITNIIATLKSKTTVVFCHIQLTSGTSPYSFFASTPKENKTAEGMVLSHAENKKTDASQSCSWQPVPLSTQVVNSCAKKSSRQKYTSQTFCSRKGQNGQVNESLMVGGTPSPVYFEKQTKGVVKETDAPPLSITEVVKPPVWKADREKRRASFLWPDVKLVSHPKAQAQNRESHSEGVSNLITSLNVRQGPEESIPRHSSENTMSTKVSDDIEKARSRETRRNEKQEQTESSEQKNATEVNRQENPPKRSPHERITDQLVSISNSPTTEKMPKINIKRKNRENVDNKPNCELGIMDQASRLTRSRDKSNLEQLVESMEVEDYMQVSLTKQSEGLIDSGVPGMAGLGSRYVRQALAPEQDEVMDTNEQVEKREEVEREREQKSQQRQSSWGFFAVSLPSFMKSPFTTQATLEEMEVVQEPPASLAQQADEEMALDEKPVLLKISCAQSEEMNIDSHYLTMSAPLVKPHGMDARCPKLTSALGAPAPESMKVAQQVFNPSRPVAHLLSVLTDTKRPFAPTSGMLEDVVVSLQMTSGEEPMEQGNTEQVISPDVASVEGPSFVQPLIKPTMPKLLPAQNMNGKTWQPVMHSGTHAVMQQSMQMGSNGDLLPAVPQIVAVPGSASQPHLLTCVLDPNDQIKMEQLQPMPATADPSSDCVDVSDSDEDDDSDDEVELDLETIEKLSQLETSPDHARVIIKLLAEKELQEAMQLRTESEPDSDSDCCDKSELTELLGSEAMGNLTELKACMNMYHVYGEKLAVLLAEEESSGQCNM